MLLHNLTSSTYKPLFVQQPSEYLHGDSFAKDFDECFIVYLSSLAGTSGCKFAKLDSCK